MRLTREASFARAYFVKISSHYVDEGLWDNDQDATLTRCRNSMEAACAALFA